ncbi:MAG TPA: nuclear transport factor 2 family protein, partial [Bacteroidota bacterium]|nr:nuclear transport factor 2 family protein [Bacteroidota bacterium]
MSHKDSAKSFLRLVVARKIHEAYTTYVAKDMRHHNPWFAGDAGSLEKAMEENHAKHPQTVIDIKQVLEDGNLVTVHSHIRIEPGEPGFATVHIFRFDGDRIVEMWDI